MKIINNRAVNMFRKPHRNTQLTHFPCLTFFPKEKSADAQQISQAIILDGIDIGFDIPLAADQTIF